MPERALDIPRKEPWITLGMGHRYPSERALDIRRKEPWISLGMGHRYPSERALDIPRKGHRISSERAWISLRKDPGYPRKGLWDILGEDFGISLGKVPGYPSTYYFSMPNSSYPTPVRIIPVFQYSEPSMSMMNVNETLSRDT
jgi:hypothetical protein